MDLTFFEVVGSAPELVWAAVTLLLFSVGTTWVGTRWVYDSRLKAHAEDIKRLQRQLEEGSPERLLHDREALRKLAYQQADDKYATQIKAKDAEIESLTRQMNEAQKEQRTGTETRDVLTSWSALINTISHDLSSAEAQKQQLEALRESAFHNYLGKLLKAAHNAAAKEREEAEKTKDSKLHIFFKEGDRRAEFAHLEKQMRFPAKTVKAVMLHKDGKGTLVRVIGPDWYKALTEAGWSNKPVEEGHPATTAAVLNWTLESARQGRQNTMIYPGKDHVSFETEVAGVTRCLVILATLRGGWPYPMAEFFTGDRQTVREELAAWLSEHRAKA